MDAGERAAALAEEEQAELIARRAAALLQELDALEWRLDRLEASLLPLVNRQNPLPI